MDEYRREREEWEKRRGAHREGQENDHSKGDSSKGDERPRVWLQGSATDTSVKENRKSDKVSIYEVMAQKKAEELAPRFGLESEKVELKVSPSLPVDGAGAEKDGVIYLHEGEFAQGRERWEGTLAHELAHLAQREKGTSLGTIEQVEGEAEALGRMAMQGELVRPPTFAANKHAVFANTGAEEKESETDIPIFVYHLRKDLQDEFWEFWDKSEIRLDEWMAFCKRLRGQHPAFVPTVKEYFKREFYFLPDKRVEYLERKLRISPHSIVVASAEKYTYLRTPDGWHPVEKSRIDKSFEGIKLMARIGGELSVQIALAGVGLGVAGVKYLWRLRELQGLSQAKAALTVLKSFTGLLDTILGIAKDTTDDKGLKEELDKAQNIAKGIDAAFSAACAGLKIGFEPWKAPAKDLLQGAGNLLHALEQAERIIEEKEGLRPKFVDSAGLFFSVLGKLLEEE